MDSTLYLITMCGWLLGGFVNGIVGFGAALVAMPIVASGLDMPLAVSTCGLVVLSLNLQMAWNYRSELDSSGIKAVILGGIPGAFCGL
ncbi:MAG: sulfite exporter TauE/SafE family protein, partial [Deltaproteobacteria bacterium HGW-Deltaproteobacteria-20]